MNISSLWSRIVGISSIIACIGLPATIVLATAAIPSPADIKVAITGIFPDAPEMISIAQCESSFQQYRTDGSTFTGGGGAYIGVFQIAKGHDPFAKTLGFDIYTLDGNLHYARYLYDHEGTNPWRGCVKTKVSSRANTIKTTHTSTFILKHNLGIGDNNSEVKTLQIILNKTGFFVARKGPGSPDQETTTFGVGTLNALKRFQCIHNIVCNGTPSTTGYGYVGPTTRAALLKEGH